MVYKFKWKRCSSLHLGQTSHLFHTWISGHLGISALTGKRRVNLPPTSILSHHCETRHQVSPNDFTTLSTSSSNSTIELLIRESLLIKDLIHPLTLTPVLYRLLSFNFLALLLLYNSVFLLRLFTFLSNHSHTPPSCNIILHVATYLLIITLLMFILWWCREMQQNVRYIKRFLKCLLFVFFAGLYCSF